MSGGDVFLSATVLEFSLLIKHVLNILGEPDTAWDSETKKQNCYYPQADEIWGLMGECGNKPSKENQHLVL